MQAILKFMAIALVGTTYAGSALASHTIDPANQIDEATVPDGFIDAKIRPAANNDENAVEASPKKITDKRHPQYIRCRVEPIASSRLNKRRVCMTNKQWKYAIRLGNKYARDFVDDNQPGFAR